MIQVACFQNMGPLSGLNIKGDRSLAADSQAEQPAQKTATVLQLSTPKLKLASRMPLAASGNAEQGDVRTQHNLPGGMPLAAPEKIEAKVTAAFEQALHNTQQRQLKQALEDKEIAFRARDAAQVETMGLRKVPKSFAPSPPQTSSPQQAVLSSISMMPMESQAGVPQSASRSLAATPPQTLAPVKIEADVPADVASSFDSNERNSLRLKELLRVLMDSAVISPEQMEEIWKTDIGDSFDKNGARIKCLLMFLSEAGKISKTDMEAIWDGETPTKTPTKTETPTKTPQDSGFESGSQTELGQRRHDNRSRSPHRSMRRPHAHVGGPISQPEKCEDLDPPEEYMVSEALKGAENSGLPSPPSPVRIAYRAKRTKTFYLWCDECKVWIAHLNFSAQASKCEGELGGCPHFDGEAYEATLLRKARVGHGSHEGNSCRC